MKRLISADAVADAFAAGRTVLHAPPGTTIVTPAAFSKAAELGVVIHLHGAAASAPAAPPVSQDAGSCARVEDPSGIRLVRADSVRLGRFDGAGPDRNIGLTDVITGRDGSPMTAGIMAWGRQDAFPWALDYDEVDLVLEGVLRITVDGRDLDGRPGDVFYIPKGSRIIFGTPSRTRVFYVTYPADWAAAANPLARPLK